MPETKGLLFIGDPHLASRPPGFRKDDYPATILEKLRWCLNYAAENHLKPVLLGDLFDFPRDNANWLLVRLLPLLEDNTLAIYGNHDCKENTLDENDTLSILVHANKIRLLDEQHIWTGTINNQPTVIGGTSWGQPLPKSFTHSTLNPLVFWIAHHDLRFQGYEESARIDCREIPGVHFLINGHIHRDLPSMQAGQTLWINPGNIARIKRSDATRNHQPSVLRADIPAPHDAGVPAGEPSPRSAYFPACESSPCGAGVPACHFSRIPIPHAPFDEVFHLESPAQTPQETTSVFIRALAEFESLRTASGAGLRAFLDANLPQFQPNVANEINLLANEVLQDAQ